MNVALIIPTVGRSTLWRAIASAQKQEYPFKEIIVVNDGLSDLPTDDTYDNVRFVKTSGLEGLPAARAHGLKALSTEIDAVCYLDDDDELLPIHVSTLLPLIKAGNAFAFSKALFVYPVGPSTEDPEPQNKGPKRYYDPNALMDQNIAPVSSFMHAVYASREIGGWDKTMLRMEDWDFWGRMFIRFGPPAFANKVTNVIYKGTPGNLTDSSRFSYSMACSWRDIVADRLKAMRAENIFRVNGNYLKRFHVPRVGVVMPFHNAERYISEAVESILSQTYQDFEIIGINDGSTDKSRDIFMAYRDSRLRIFDLPRNVGVTGALNFGLLVSRSEFIARMDADDVSLPTRFEEQVKYLDEHKDIMVLGTWFDSMNAGLDSVMWRNMTPTSPEEVRSALLKRCCIGHPTVMMRRRIIETCGGYDESPDYKAIEDYELWLRISQRFKIANLDKNLLKYRSHPSQVSVALNNDQADRARKLAEKYKAITANS